MHETNEVNETANPAKVFWIVGVIAVILVGVFAALILNPSIVDKIKNFNNKPEYVPTIQGVKTVLEGQIPSFVPEVQSTSTAYVIDLDKNIIRFMPHGVVPKTVTRQIYKDGTKGFLVNYETSQNVFDTYSELTGIASSISFTITKASRTNIASIIAAESKDYKVKIFIEKIEESKTKVTLEVQNIR